MTKSIEQIAKETWAEVSKSTTVGESIAVKFAQALLAKIGEGLEPVSVAFQHEDTGRNTSIEPTLANDFEKMNPRWFKAGELYATPHEAIIAAEQRVAEACAKACEKEAVQIVIDGPEERAYNNAVSDCAEAIRSGEWRKYIKE